MNHILPLRDFLHEQEVSEQPYKIVVFVNTTADVRDVGDKTRKEFDLLNKAAKNLGIEMHHVDFVGCYVSSSAASDVYKRQTSS